MRLKTANNNRRRYDRKALLRERIIVFGKQRWRGKLRRQMERHVRQMHRELEQRFLTSGPDVPFLREIMEKPPTWMKDIPVGQDFGPAVGGPMHAMFLDVNRRYRK